MPYRALHFFIGLLRGQVPLEPSFPVMVGAAGAPLDVLLLTRLQRIYSWYLLQGTFVPETQSKKTLVRAHTFCIQVVWVFRISANWQKSTPPAQGPIIQGRVFWKKVGSMKRDRDALESRIDVYKQTANVIFSKIRNPTTR